MKTNRILLVFAGVLLFAAVIFALKQTLRGMHRTDTASSQATDERQSTQREWADFTFVEDDAAIERELAKVGAEGLDDPFYRPRFQIENSGGSPVETSELILEGLALGSGTDGAGAFALISGQVLRIGDHVGSFQLSAIQRDRVVLASPGSGRFELRFSDPASDQAGNYPETLW